MPYPRTGESSKLTASKSTVSLSSSPIALLLPHRPLLPASQQDFWEQVSVAVSQSSPSYTFLLTDSHNDDVFTHLRTHVLAYLLTHVPTYLPPPRTYGTKPSRTEATPTTSTTSRRCTSRVSAPTSASTSMAQSGPAPGQRLRLRK